MQSFYSHGKLLLTAEYVVLDGAKALALPTKYGQTLTVETINEPKIIWQSLDFENMIWFEEEFSFHNVDVLLTHQNDNPISKRLIEIFKAAKQLNPEFLSAKKGYKVVSKLEFPQNWGLGSSSTLLNNIAQWAKVDAFALSHATFGGSGYDIACAQHGNSIVYSIENKKPNIKPLAFKKPFEDQLFFVHLNRKQDSRKSIQTYQDNKENTATIISKINAITESIIATNAFDTFETLIQKHEALIGDITKQTPIKERLFSDYTNSIKSLGGWNGDFVLATGEKDYTHRYFKSKGHNTIISFKDMILNA